MEKGRREIMDFKELPKDKQKEIMTLADDFQKALLPLATYCMATRNASNVEEMIKRTMPIKGTLERALTDIDEILLLLGNGKDDQAK